MVKTCTLALNHLCIGLVLTTSTVLTTSFAFAPVPALATIMRKDTPQWSHSGDTFATYGVFKDKLAEAMRSARTKIFVASQFLSDGDIATALFAAKLRGVRVLVLLDKRESVHFLSRHEYLTRNGVPTFIKPLASLQMEGLSTIAIDEKVWRVDARFDDKASGPVRIEPSPYTTHEVHDWFTSQKTQSLMAPKFAQAEDAANTPTSPLRTVRKASDTIAMTRSKQGSGQLPTRLPRETRWQRLQNGQSSDDPFVPFSEFDGSARIPDAPSGESDVLE